MIKIVIEKKDRRILGFTDHFDFNNAILKAGLQDHFLEYLENTGCDWEVNKWDRIEKILVDEKLSKALEEYKELPARNEMMEKYNNQWDFNRAVAPILFFLSAAEVGDMIYVSPNEYKYKPAYRPSLLRYEEDFFIGEGYVG